ncbi:hypothetical protein PSHT_02765 [Puccinia striiformis]|uniref:Uncharacterized protein n=1 Tax=Puccinia striiformis TaxID=27350 RepID=A0A2S4WHE3_9BASI|nr:hypothetical protein PSHT_02765 [Puccinia striiformis]
MSDMAQSKNEPNDKLNLQLPGKQGNFIIRFQRLTTFVERCYVPADQHHDRATIEVLMSTSSIDEAGLKEITLDRLQSTLPLLKSQLTALAALARLLDLSCLQQQTESRIKRVMLLQAVFGQTMDYINFDIALVGTESTCKAKRSNDQDLGRVNVNELLKSSNGGLSPGELEFHTQAHGVLACHRYTHKQAARFIDTTIEPIDGFKWAPAQKGWTGQLERADVRWRKMRMDMGKNWNIRGVGSRELPMTLTDGVNFQDVFDSPYYFMIPISEDHSPTNRAEQHASTYSTNEAGAKETALNRLQRTLPAWKRQLAAYSRLLDPPESQEEAETNLEAVLHAAAELQATTQYLAVDITTVQSEPTRSDDHHLKRLKSYRLHKIHSMLTAACDLIRGSYLKGNEIFGYLEIGLSPEESERRGTQQMALKEAALVIGLAIECIKESDWHLALKYWKSDSKYITRLLENFLEDNTRC